MIYLSGPISNGDTTDKEGQQKNQERFYALENKFVEQGYEVFNPAKLEQDGWTWEQYLARDLQFIYENRPKLLMMKGWRQSLGARLEWEWAKLLRLEVEYEDEVDNGTLDRPKSGIIRVDAL